MILEKKKPLSVPIILIIITALVQIERSQQLNSMPQNARSFDVKACWSKAGIGTSIVIQQRSDTNKGFQIVFDLGW